jgi:ubiquinone/menaquinone biosynthesis C-methylase UbiE
LRRPCDGIILPCPPCRSPGVICARRMRGLSDRRLIAAATLIAVDSSAMESKGKRQKQPTTAWGEVADWYDQLVGDEGSEYQRHVVFPGVLRLLAIQQGQKVLDVACGQGVFCRILHERGAVPTGVDAAAELVSMARQRSDPAIAYQVGDARSLGFLPEGTFAAATCILAIQNIDSVPPVLSGIARTLGAAGRLVLVMMHPCFRGPKYSSWEWDEKAGLQFRRVDRYLLPRKEPIVTHPGRKTGRYTWTFHRPIEFYVNALRKAGLLIDALEEWPSHKTSTSGPRAPAENTARKEIPMFLALRAVKPPQAAPATHAEA